MFNCKRLEEAHIIKEEYKSDKNLEKAYQEDWAQNELWLINMFKTRKVRLQGMFTVKGKWAREVKLFEAGAIISKKSKKESALL